MPSPCPGMDPFIEFQVWDEFHSSFIHDLADALVPQLRPKYVVRRERRVYVETDPEDPQRYISVREADSLEVVTVIEVLSPANKRPGSDGWNEYLAKRDAVLESTANLVEIDLLRGGKRLPTVQPLPPGDFFALVCRTRRRPRAEVYAWTLRQPLPTIPIPLKGDDPDVVLDLQQLFTRRFDSSGYDYSLKYDVTPEPPFDPATAEWVTGVLAEVRANG